MKGSDTMERRKFLANLTAGAALGATAACASSQTSSDAAPALQTAPRVTWRLASSFPRSLDTIYGAADTLAERVSELTDGKFTIRPYPGGELVPAFSVLDAVQKGTVPIGHSASYYYKGKNPALAFDCAVPFGMTVRQQIAWINEGGGLEIMRKVFADFNMTILPGGNTGCQMGGWFRNEINTLSDLKTLKMRIPGFGGEVMSALGATVQMIPGGDIFPSLERGTIDAAEWVGPYDDEKLGFHKVAKNYYYPGWWEPGPALSFMINLDEWAKLPRVYQQALETAAADASITMMARYDAKNPPALARLLAEGVKLRPFSDEIMTAAQDKSVEILEGLAANDTQFREVYEPWKKFKADSDQWFATAELAFQRFAFQS